MNNTWEPPETQPPDQPQPPELIGFHAAHGWLILGAVSIAVSVVAAAVDYLTGITVQRGVFSILAAVSVAGFCGWTVQSAEVRNRRDLGIMLAGACRRQHEMLNQIGKLTAAVERLEQQTASRTTNHAPKRNDGHRYIGATALADSDTIPLSPILAPEAEAALRRINMRLIKRVNGSEQG